MYHQILTLKILRSARTLYLFVCSLWISERTSVICVYSIGELVFIADTECVYCAVRTVMPVKFCQNCQTFRWLYTTAWVAWQSLGFDSCGASYTI